jgi:hypothetical protein
MKARLLNNDATITAFQELSVLGQGLFARSWIIEVDCTILQSFKEK